MDVETQEAKQGWGEDEEFSFHQVYVAPVKKSLKHHGCALALSPGSLTHQLCDLGRITDAL